jgi:hypothetical protein
MEHISTIKNGAVNGKNARTCIQRRDLAQYGFGCHQQIDIAFLRDTIHIQALDQGKNKVSCVRDNRRGYEYQTIDIRWNLAERELMFGSADKLEVLISNGLIVIQAAK